MAPAHLLCLTKDRSQILQSQTSSLRSAAQGGEYSDISEKDGLIERVTSSVFVVVVIFFVVVASAAWLPQGL